MRLVTKVILTSCGAFALLGLLAAVCLTTPRDFASPSTVIRVVNPSGAPVNDLKVERYWYDSDSGNEGNDETVADQNGNYAFPKVPADVGLFTGAWRRTYSQFGMCAAGRGTHTTVYIRFQGRYGVLPRDKSLHPVGEARQDSDGTWFSSTVDSQSNTLVSLRFPPKTKGINYVLSAKQQAE